MGIGRAGTPAAPKLLGVEPGEVVPSTRKDGTEKLHEPDTVSKNSRPGLEKWLSS